MPINARKLETFPLLTSETVNKVKYQDFGRLTRRYLGISTVNNGLRYFIVLYCTLLFSRAIPVNRCFMAALPLKCNVNRQIPNSVFDYPTITIVKQF